MKVKSETRYSQLCEPNAESHSGPLQVDPSTSIPTTMLYFHRSPPKSHGLPN